LATPATEGGYIYCVWHDAGRRARDAEVVTRAPAEDQAVLCIVSACPNLEASRDVSGPSCSALSLGRMRTPSQPTSPAPLSNGAPTSPAPPGTSELDPLSGARCCCRLCLPSPTLDIGTPSTSPRPSDADSDLERDLALAERELEDEESLQEDAGAGGGRGSCPKTLRVFPRQGDSACREFCNKL
jgi:hypothetical protein